MKKSFLLFTVIAAFLMLPNFSMAKELSGTTTTVIGGANIKASTGVKLFASTNTGNTSFAVRTKHKGGDKIYEATSVNPSVVESAGVVGTDITAAPTAP